MKKSYQKKKNYRLACKMQNRRRYLNDAEGKWEIANPDKRGSMALDGLAGAVKDKG